jgi:hypothetical protein
MKLNAAIVFALAVTPAFFACKDRTDRDRDRIGRTTTSPGTTGTAPIAGREPGAPSDTTDKSVTGIDKNRAPIGTGNEVKGQAVTAKLSSKGSLTFTGTAKVHDLTDSGGLVTINLTNSTPGVYSAYLFDSDSCADVPMMDASGNISTGDSANGKKADKIADAGEITVGSDGTGYLDASLTNVRSTAVRSLENKVVALFSKKPEPSNTKVTGTTTSRGLEACGVLTTAKIDDTAG